MAYLALDNLSYFERPCTYQPQAVGTDLHGLDALWAHHWCCYVVFDTWCSFFYSVFNYNFIPFNLWRRNKIMVINNFINFPYIRLVEF